MKEPKWILGTDLLLLQRTPACNRPVLSDSNDEVL